MIARHGWTRRYHRLYVLAEAVAYIGIVLVILVGGSVAAAGPK